MICLTYTLRKFEIVNCVFKQNGCRPAGSPAIPVCYNISHKKKRKFCKRRTSVKSVAGELQIFNTVLC